MLAVHQPDGSPATSPGFPARGDSSLPAAAVVLVAWRPSAVVPLPQREPTGAGLSLAAVRRPAGELAWYPPRWPWVLD